jgi:4-carboxymuconolactone decarboxylase
MPGKPRIPVLADPDPAVAELLQTTITRDGEPLNIFRTMAHHPVLLKQFNRMGGALLRRGLLSARAREIVILRVGWRSGSVYEFGQHTVIARRAGLQEHEIVSLAKSSIGDDFASDERDLIALADEIAMTSSVTDATWNRLAARWSDGELVELLLLAGYYRMVSGFLNAARVQSEEGVPGWPPGAERI